MRTSAASSSRSGSSRVKEDLAQLVHHIHKTSIIHKISNDSGVSFSGEGSGSKPDRQATGSSIASTITPETAPDRASTAKADPTPHAPSSSDVDPAQPDRPSKLPLLARLGADDDPNVVASPTALKSPEPFFDAGPSSSSSFSLSPSSSQDFELNDLWDSLARELKPIADIMRTGRHRTPLGDSRLPADCISALKLWLATDSPTSKQPPNHHVLEAAIEIFRVLANLCIDHDVNRTILDGLQAAPTVLAAVSAILRRQDQSRSSALFSIKILTLLRAAMGAVLNMQLEHIATRQSLANADCISTLSSVASHPRIYLPHLWALPQTVALENDTDALSKLKMGATVASWAWRVIQEIFDDAKEEKDGQPSTPSDEMHDGEDEDASMRDVRSILSRRCFINLLRPLSYYTPAASASGSGRRLELDVDDVEELVDSDAEILQTAAALIESCAADDHDFRQRAVRRFEADSHIASTSTQIRLEDTFDSGLDALMSFVEKAELPREWVRDLSGLDGVTATTDEASADDAQAAEEMRKAFAQVKASAARAVVAISGDDANMVELFSGASGFIDRLKAWIRYDPKERDDLVSCGMLALGNLARSDAHCLSLVQEHGLAPFLASLLTQADDIKVAHGLVSLLKNLSIAVPNKPVIGQLGVIGAVTRFLNQDKDMVQPLQFATAGVLKHLCAAVTENAVRLVNGDEGGSSALNALVDMIQRIDDVPTKMEATRVLVNVVKSLWTSARSNGASQAVTEDAIFSARRKVVRRDVIQALAEMVRTSPKYPVLVNEGIIALTLVGSERVGAELVSLSLLAEPSKANAGEDEDEEMASDTEAAALRAPRRRSTVDSSASTSSHPLPPPARALDMVNLVLARRDARMPPQFASNACALVLSLCHATQGDSTGAIGQDAVARVASQTRWALERLRDQGPTEALAAAADALGAVSQLCS